MIGKNELANENLQLICTYFLLLGEKDELELLRDDGLESEFIDVPKKLMCSSIVKLLLYKYAKEKIAARPEKDFSNWQIKYANSISYRKN